jgi:hypothetical protein
VARVLSQRDTFLRITDASPFVRPIVRADRIQLSLRTRACIGDKGKTRSGSIRIRFGAKVAGLSPFRTVTGISLKITYAEMTRLINSGFYLARIQPALSDRQREVSAPPRSRKDTWREIRAQLDHSSTWHRSMRESDSANRTGDIH